LEILNQKAVVLVVGVPLPNRPVMEDLLRYVRRDYPVVLEEAVVALIYVLLARMEVMETGLLSVLLKGMLVGAALL
tara:strand:- start:672 stop:899 length:228 start_codon:yes stop_codon:yes gene_type:complete